MQPESSSVTAHNTYGELRTFFLVHLVLTFGFLTFPLVYNVSRSNKILLYFKTKFLRVVILNLLTIRLLNFQFFYKLTLSVLKLLYIKGFCIFDMANLYNYTYHTRILKQKLCTKVHIYCKA